MKKFFLISICAISMQSIAQVNIGANTTPNTDAMLEISGGTKGLLLPRVALSSTSSFSPLSAHVAGMAVYNTATAGAGATAVTPGYYYNTGSAWTKIATGNGNAWLTGGNLNGASSTIGTNDNFDFPFITNAIERMRVTSTGNLGIGTVSPVAKLDVAASITTSNTVVNGTGSINDYLQFNIQNTSTGTRAQSGYAATADNGSATTGFAWMGINNSAFNFPTTYNVGGANDVSFLGSGQDLYIANAHNTKSIIFSTGRATTPFFNERMRITNAGNVGIGTATPINRLTIYHTSNTDGLIIQNTTGGPGSTANIYMTAYSDIVAGTFRPASRISAIDDGGFSAHLTFSTKVTGADANALTERMRITSAGFIGIGTATPITKLDLIGIKSTGSGTGTGANNDAPSQAIIPGGSTGTNRFNDWPSGWGGGLSTLDICGSGTYFSSYVTRSDSRLKQDIHSMNDQIMSNLLKLRPVTYFMKEQIKESEGLQYGFIAQEVKELFPSIVTESSDPNGTIGINYQALIAPAIYVLQQQEAKISKLQIEIETFKLQNDNLRKMIIEIEKLKMQLKSLQETNSK